MSSSRAGQVFSRAGVRSMITETSLSPTRPTPRVVVDDATLDHGPIHVNVLTDGLEAKLVEVAERGEAGSVEYVEAYQMGSAGTSVLGGPRPLSSHHRPNPRYTLKCEEPLLCATSGGWGTRLTVCDRT